MLEVSLLLGLLGLCLLWAPFWAVGVALLAYVSGVQRLGIRACDSTFYSYKLNIIIHCFHLYLLISISAIVTTLSVLAAMVCIDIAAFSSNQVALFWGNRDLGLQRGGLLKAFKSRRFKGFRRLWDLPPRPSPSRRLADSWDGSCVNFQHSSESCHVSQIHT